MSKLLKSKFLLGVFAFALMFAVSFVASADNNVITKTLRYGMKDAQVLYLQQTLNAKGYTVADAGHAGSSGMETSYFGNATKTAVKSFQTAMGLVSDGIFGKLSRAALDGSVTPPSSDLCPNGNTVASSCTVAPGGSVGPLCPNGMTVASNCTVAPGGTNPVLGVVSLASDNPAPRSLVSTEAGADLAHFNFGVTGKVTSVTLKRIGISADASLSNVYLYDGTTRLTDAASVTSGSFVTFNDPLGLFEGPKVISVKADMASAAGETVGIQLVGYTLAGTATTLTAPISGNLMSVAVVSSMAAVTFGTVTPTTNSALNPGTDIVVWQSTASVQNRDVWLNRFSINMTGSVAKTDVNNFRLIVGSTTVATVANADANGYVNFVPTTPYKLTTGSPTFKVMADVIGGSGSSFTMKFKNKVDIGLVDSQYNVAFLTGTGLSSLSGNEQTVIGGTVTVQKATDSPSSTVVLNATDAVLAKYKVTIYGEQVKADTLTVDFTSSDATAVIRNGRILVGADTASMQQVGSTTNIDRDADTTATDAGTAYNINYSFPVGVSYIEVRGDVYAASGTAFANGHTIQMSLYGNAALNNATGKVSGDTIDFPGTSNVAANTLTVGVGTLTLAKDQTYGNQTVVLPGTATEIGQFVLTSGTNESINADTLTLTLTGTGTPATDVTNLYVTYGSNTSSIKPMGAASQSWSVSESIAANATMTFKVYADLGTTLSTNTVIPTLTVSGTSNSGSAVSTAAVVGQTITGASSGVLTVSLDSGTPTSAQVVAGSTDPAGSLKVKLAGTNEDQYVKSLTVHVNSVANSAAIASLNLSSSSTSTGTYTTVGSDQTLASDGTIPGYATWTLTGASRIAVAKNGSVYLKVTPTYVSTGQNSAVSGKTPILALTDLQAEGTAVLVAAGAGSDLIASTGIVPKANSSSTFVASGDTVNDATVDTADTTFTVTGNTAFTPGDIIFVDLADDDGFFGSEELMVVLLDSGTTLTVQRGAFGTTAVSHATASLINGNTIYRLSGAVGTYTNAGIIGNPMTVLGTKLSLALAGNSPSGATSAGTSKIVFSFVASAANNSADVATNTATLTYVDITTTESSASISNLILYPSDYDTNATYVTTCGALTASKWRCTMSTVANTNQIDENSSRTYVVRGDTAYSANGSIDISIAALGTSSTSTNSVYWTDGTTAQYWVNQSSTYIQNASPLSSTVAFGTVDATGPSIASMVFGGTADNALDVADTIVVTWSEPIDPTTIAATLVPGGSAVAITDGATGDLVVAVTTGVLTATNIFTTDIDAGDPGAATYANTVTLDATGKILTFTITAVSTGSAALAGAETFTDVTGLTTTVKDANAIVQADSAVTPTGNI